MSGATTTISRDLPRLSNAVIARLRRIDDQLATLEALVRASGADAPAPLAEILAAYDARPMPPSNDAEYADGWAYAIKAMLGGLSEPQRALVEDLADPESGLCALRLGQDSQAYLTLQFGHGRSVLNLLARPAPDALPELHQLLGGRALTAAQKMMWALAEDGSAAAVISHHLYGGAAPGDASLFYVREGRHTESGHDEVVDHRTGLTVHAPQATISPHRLVAMLNQQPTVAQAYAATSQMVDYLRVIQVPALAAAEIAHAQVHQVLVATVFV